MIYLLMVIIRIVNSETANNPYRKRGNNRHIKLPVKLKNRNNLRKAQTNITINPFFVKKCAGS